MLVTIVSADAPQQLYFLSLPVPGRASPALQARPHPSDIPGEKVKSPFGLGKPANPIRPGEGGSIPWNGHAFRQTAREKKDPGRSRRGRARPRAPDDGR